MSDNCIMMHASEQMMHIILKRGEKDKADFWPQVNGEIILIQYFTARDTDGSYRGVIEVSQEITKIKTLEGEKRLLNW